MNLCGYPSLRLNPDWGPCMHELLFHTSRYAETAAHWLGGQARQADFSLHGYRAQCLTPAQRFHMATLLGFPLSLEAARAVCWRVRQLARAPDLACADCAARHYRHCPRHARARAPFRGVELAPYEPFLSLAARLPLRAELRGREIEVCFRQLARWLDGPNPVIRANLQDALSFLGAHRYRLRDRKIGA